jgi:hypothetical protein
MELTKLARTEIERLLNNYSLAISGGTSFTAPGFNLFASNDVRHGPSIPILYGEADETRKALELLPSPQREVLMLQYVIRPPVRSRFEKMQLNRWSYYRLAEFADDAFWKALREVRKRNA